MNINANNSTYDAFVKNEIKTLGFINGLSGIKESFGDLSSQAGTLYYQYKAKEQGGHELNFQFASDFPMLIEGRTFTVILEALVLPNFSFSTYALSICDNKELLRKFHFDYAPNEVEALEKKPIYHLQYGGKATPRMKKLEINDKQISPWLSSPRLFAVPMNLALLLDMVFCEFPSDITQKISETSEWRGLIKNNEDLITKLYYSNVYEFFGRAHCSNLLFRDFYYGG